MAVTLGEVLEEIGALQRHACEHEDTPRPRWPMIRHLAPYLATHID